MYRAGDIERHPGPKRSLSRRRRLWCRTLCPPLPNVMMRTPKSSKIFESHRHPWTQRALRSRSPCIGLFLWFFTFPTEISTPASQEIALSAAVSAWLQKSSRTLSLMTLLLFHCLFRPAEARQLRWCGAQNFDRSLSTRYDRVYCIVHIKEPKNAKNDGKSHSATPPLRVSWNLSADLQNVSLNS